MTKRRGYGLGDYRRDAAYLAGLGAAQVETVVEMAFWYLANITLTALQSLTTAVSINADSDFMCLWLIASSTGGFTLSWQDNATGRLFQNNPVNSANIFGTAQLPFPMLPPYTFQRQGSIGLTVTDTSNAGNTVQIVFAGKKIFPNLTAGAAGPVSSS